MDKAAFQTFHPAVPAILFAGIIALTMFGLEPHLVGISLVSATLFALATQGVGAALDKLRWQVPLLVLICIINPLYSANGTTLLFKLGRFYIYAESVAYGLVMGALLIAVLMWIEGMAYVVGHDELLALGRGAQPTISLMASMTMRLVPQPVRRASAVRTALGATTASGADGDGKAARVRVMDALMSWALEDSLERGDAMRARGWGASQRRSSYDAHPFRSRDLVALALVIGLVVLAALGVHTIMGNWYFYPSMAGTSDYASLVPAALLYVLPPAVLAVEHIRWELLP